MHTLNVIVTILAIVNVGVSIAEGNYSAAIGWFNAFLGWALVTQKEYNQQ